MPAWTPSLEIGVAEIDEFRRRLGSLVPQWESGGDSTATLVAVLAFLDSWLTDHVKNSDQRIGDFLKR